MIKHLVIERLDDYLCVMTYGDGLVIVKVFSKAFFQLIEEDNADEIHFYGPKPECEMFDNLIKSGIVL